MSYTLRKYPKYLSDTLKKYPKQELNLATFFFSGKRYNQLSYLSKENTSREAKGIGYSSKEIPLEGVEPSRQKTIDFKSILATNYNTKDYNTKERRA